MIESVTWNLKVTATSRGLPSRVCTQRAFLWPRERTRVSTAASSESASGGATATRKGASLMGFLRFACLYPPLSHSALRYSNLAPDRSAAWQYVKLAAAADELNPLPSTLWAALRWHVSHAATSTYLIPSLCKLSFHGAKNMA
jgi:hypothetical protein